MKRITFNNWLALILPPIFVFLYFLLFKYVIWENVVNEDSFWHVGSSYKPWMLLFSYTTEIFATITFQLRIKWTAEDKIQSAAIIGAISWLSAIMGVLIMTSALLGGMLILSPPIMVATWQGIYVNHIFKELKEVK